MAILKLSSPWVIYYRQIEAMFKTDPLVHVIFDEEAYHIKVYVDEAEKAEALSILLREEQVFGNVTLKISVIPPNNEEYTENFQSPAEIYDAAFDTNDAYSFSREVLTPFGAALTYIIFRKQVVQYFTDNLADYYGLSSTLYQDIAEGIFNPLDNVYFCTDPNEAPAAITSHETSDWP